MRSILAPPVILVILIGTLTWLIGGTDEPWLAPSLSHPLGTDEFGRDLLLSTLLATLISALKGIWITAVAFASAGTVAYLTVMRESRVFSWLLRGGTQVVESIPLLLWVLAAVVAITDPRMLVVTLAFAVAALPPVGTAIAGELERLRRAPYVEAARLLGIREGRILARYIVPNTTSVLAPIAIQVLGAAIAVDGAIGVLGLGNRSDYDLGVMLLRGKEYFLVHPQLLLLSLGILIALFYYLSMTIWRLRLMRKTDTGLWTPFQAAEPLL